MSSLENAALAIPGGALFRRGLKKAIRASARHLGRLIMMASSDLDRSIKRAVYDITDELRIINGTIAAAAICSDHSEARDFLENALRDGAAVFSERAAREERQARFRATFGGTAASSSESQQTPT